MSHLLIIYATTEGHTREVARHIARTAHQEGYVAEIQDCAASPAPPTDDYDAVILGGSVHQSVHQTSLVNYVQTHRVALEQMPSAFFSVSLHAAFPGEEHQAEARGYIEQFIEETGWRPDATWMVAGALRYTQYDFFKRLVMKMIARREGQDTDTSKDHDYTDWSALTHGVKTFLAKHVDAKQGSAETRT